MSDDETRAAIAEKCGYSSIRQDAPLWFEDLGQNRFVPDYPNDLNACHEFEKTLFNDPGKWPDFAEQLTVVCFGVKTGLNDLGHIKAAYVAHATARQRCEAFLRVHGLWKDNPTHERSESK